MGFLGSAGAALFHTTTPLLSSLVVPSGRVITKSAAMSHLPSASALQPRKISRVKSGLSATVRVDSFFAPSPIFQAAINAVASDAATCMTPNPSFSAILSAGGGNFVLGLGLALALVAAGLPGAGL